MNSGHYYLSISYDFKLEKIVPKHKETLKLDLGVRNLVVSSDGDVIENPKVILSYIRKIKRLNKKASRQWRTNGGKRTNKWKKTQVRLAKLNERVKNIRKANLHKITTYLIQKAYESYAVEDLSVKDMLYKPMPKRDGKGFEKNGRILKSYFNMLLADASLAELIRQVEYKAEWAGLEVFKPDTFDPTNRECSVCGCKNDIEPSDFTWQCYNCKTIHQKYVNSLELITKYISVL